MSAICRLLGSTRSPFTRKVRIAAAVAGAAGLIELVETVASQYRTSFDPALAAANPLLQIPVLILPDGSALPDSSVIAAFIDMEYAAGTLIPQEPRARLACLQREAAADNFIAKLLRRAEEMRKAPELRSASWIEANRATVERVLDGLNAAPPAFDPDRPDIGTIALVVALDYLTFRLPEFPWRESHPKLAGWHAAASSHPAFSAAPFTD